MNHREPPHVAGGVRRALRCLSLLLLPTIASEEVHALPFHFAPRTRAAGKPAEPSPYLPAKGAPPLRFHEPAPPPDLVMRPPAAAPPSPLTPAESSVALANAAAARSTAQETTPPSPAADRASPPTPAKTPAPILRDDVRPAVRPEDFLPYFQIPGSAQQPADVTLLVPAPKNPPAPAPLPASAATYRQSAR